MQHIFWEIEIIPIFFREYRTFNNGCVAKTVVLWLFRACLVFPRCYIIGHLKLYVIKTTRENKTQTLMRLFAAVRCIKTTSWQNHGNIQTCLFLLIRSFLWITRCEVYLSFTYFLLVFFKKIHEFMNICVTRSKKSSCLKMGTPQNKV